MPTKPVSSTQQNLFVSINDFSGHEQDMRWAIKKALGTTVPYRIFQDQAKRFEQRYFVTIESLLFSAGAILDVSPSPQQGATINPEILIQLGICFAMGKQFWLPCVVNPNLDQDQLFKWLQGYYNLYPSYGQLADNFKVELSPTELQGQRRSERKAAYNHRKSRSFSVFGANADTQCFMNSFVANTDWKYLFNRRLNSKQILQSLVEEVGDRAFCIFNLGADQETELYIETHVALGISIGLGVPFLILQPSGYALPSILSGYDGVIKYRQFTELESELRKYAVDFLTPDIFTWPGSTYSQLVSRAEEQLELVEDEKELDKVEEFLTAITTSTDNLPQSAYAALGDLYREKFYKFSDHEIELLKRAKDYYEEAPRLARCQDGATVVNKQIELIELLQEKKFRSIYQLIRLLGEEITSENYAALKNFLLREVGKLVQKEEHLHAINLLSTMQLHDESAEINEMIEKILEKRPNIYREAFQDAQNYIKEIEAQEANLTQKLSELKTISKTKILHLSQQAKQSEAEVAKLSEQIAQTKEEKHTLSVRLESAMHQNQQLATNLAQYETQLDSVRSEHEKLMLTNEQLTTRGGVLRDQFEAERQFSGRTVLVNFGIGWALYTTLGGEPNVKRDGHRITPNEGFEITDGDIIFHAGTPIQFTSRRAKAS